MAAPTIPNGEEYFFPLIYEGNSAGQRVGKFVPFTDNGTIANSVLFNDDDDAYLARTFSTPTNNKKWTYSVWIKRGALGTDQAIMSADYDGASYWDMRFNTSNQIYIQNRIGSSNILLANTTRTFEDTSKWYHLVFVYDSDNSTSTSRAILYIDGDIQTLSAYPSSGDASAYNVNSEPHHIGVSRTNSTSGAIWSEFDGYFAEANFVDGQALTPASFGLTDTSTGRWIPKTVSPYPTTTTSIAVTVVDSGGNKYALDGVTQGTVTLIEGATYRFDQSDGSNSGHPLRFSTTSNGTHGGGTEFTSGVTTAGTPGSSGAYTEITVPTGTATLYYYCTNHSGMGGTANTQDQYGTNGFRLKFQDSSALGDDTSGNTNDFSVTNIVAGDQTTDSPTQNFSTLEASSSGSMTLSEGNLRYTTASSSNWESVYNDKSISSGKWYFELTCKVTTAYDVQPGVILESVLAANKNQLMGYTDGSVGYNMDGSQNTVYYGNSASSYVAQPATQVDAGDIVGVAYDADTGAMWFAKNNTWVNNGTGVGNPSTGANPTWVQGSFAGQKVRFGFSTYNASASSEVNFGQRSFTYTPPTGFVALQQDNLPETAKGISGLVWTKNRDAADSHQLYDSSRGKQKAIFTDATSAESTVTDGLQKFLAGGQQIEDDVSINTSGESYVSWNWVANGGTTETNTDGNTTVTLQKNTDAGFSIGTFKSTSASQTLGHGLGVAPEVIILKCTSTTQNWLVYHKQLDLTDAHYLHLNTTDAEQTGSDFGNTLPTSTVFTANPTGVADRDYCFWAWKSVDGFSKFGKFTGNGSADGPFIYTGFRPAWIMWKRTNSTNQWVIHDSTRNPFNPTNQILYANLTQADGTGDAIVTDLLSNGFKLRSGTNGNANTSGSTYIYMAFAEHPFVGDGTNPVTAR